MHLDVSHGQQAATEDPWAGEGQGQTGVWGTLSGSQVEAGHGGRGAAAATMRAAGSGKVGAQGDSQVGGQL